MWNRGDPHEETRILETSGGDDILDSVLLNKRGQRLWDPIFSNEDSVIVATSLTDPHDDESEPLRSRLLEIDVVTRSQKVLLDLDARIVDFDVDSTGRHFLISTFDGYRGSRAVRPLLYWDRDRSRTEPIEFGEGPYAVEW